MKSVSALAVLQVVAAFMLLWEAFCWLTNSPAYFLPRPSIVLLEIWSAPLWYLRQCYFTFATTFLGFGLALILGVVMAIGIAYSKLIERTLYTLLVSLNSIPKIALAP